MGAGLDGQAAWRGSGLQWNSKGKNGPEGEQEGHPQSLLECEGSPAGWQQDPWQVRGCGKPSHPAECFHSGITVAAQEDQWGCSQRHTPGELFWRRWDDLSIGILLPNNFFIQTVAENHCQESFCKFPWRRASLKSRNIAITALTTLYDIFLPSSVQTKF